LQDSPKFVTKEQVLLLHELQINRFGGAFGIVNEGLLDSALAQPKATFFGEFLHREIHEQAAAYLYHLVKNHPFLDGNKRVGAAVMEVFLRINGYVLTLSNEELYNLTMQVAQGQLSKDEVSALIYENMQPLDSKLQ
jgi:death-on-curing protein